MLVLVVSSERWWLDTKWLTRLTNLSFTPAWEWQPYSALIWPVSSRPGSLEGGKLSQPVEMFPYLPHPSCKAELKQTYPTPLQFMPMQDEI